MTDTPGGTPGGDGGQGGGDNPGAGAGAPWYGDIQDESLRGWAENKNFDSAETALQSYQNLEQMFGADRAGRTIEIPKSDADETVMGEFYNKLGRPEAADKYDFGQLPDNADTEFVEFAKGSFHKHGLSDSQARAVVEDYNNFVAGRSQADQDKSTEALNQEQDALRKEWGSAYDENIDRGKAAAREFGLTEDVVTAIEKAAGFSGVMKFMANVGSKLGEGKFLGEKTGADFEAALTPAQAEAKIAELNSDKQWMSEYLNGSKTHLAQMDRLQQMRAAKA